MDLAPRQTNSFTTAPRGFPILPRLLFPEQLKHDLFLNQLNNLASGWLLSRAGKEWDLSHAAGAVASVAQSMAVSVLFVET